VISPDGTRIAVGGEDGAARVYDARTGAQLLRLVGLRRFTVPQFSRDGTRILTTAEDGIVRLYDARTGAEVLQLRGPEGFVFATFSPDEAHVAVTGKDGVRRLHDARTGAVTLQSKESKDVRHNGVSPDGTLVAAWVGGGVVRLCDTRTGAELCRLEGAFRPVHAPVFSPDGTRIAVVGQDRVGRLYDVRTGAEVRQFTGRYGLTAILFSPDGGCIATESVDGVRLYEAPPDPAAWQAERCKALADGLPGWHRAQAGDSHSESRWFAAAFHWEWVARAEPASGAAHYNRGIALAHLGRSAEAKQAFETALARKTGLGQAARGFAHATLGQWDEAARLYAKATEEGPAADLATWRGHALLCLQQGDQEGYRKACAAMVERFGKTTDVWTANGVAWACALQPSALPDSKTALRLAGSAARAIPRSSQWQFRRTRGAVLHRLGQHKEAAADFEEAIELEGKGGSAADLFFLAMVRNRLGQIDEARKTLEQAEQAAANRPPVFWPERLEVQLLRGEARKVLRDASSGKD
jgi:tetratricopeptide (TPR) repeat protein